MVQKKKTRLLGVLFPKKILKLLGVMVPKILRLLGVIIPQPTTGCYIFCHRIISPNIQDCLGCGIMKTEYYLCTELPRQYPRSPGEMF